MAAQSSVVANVRRLALLAGAVALLAVGALFLFTGLQGGVALLIAAIPPLGAGSLIVRGVRFARALGLVVAIVYGGFVAVVATTPLRGVTPPPGQSRDPLDPVAVALTIVLFVVALLIGVGARGRAATETKVSP